MRAAKLIGKDGEPKYTPHALRHFFASWCINPKARGGRELPPKQVQYLLGHSTISMTFDTYGHLFRRQPRRVDRSGATVVGVNAPRQRNHLQRSHRQTRCAARL
ncbi:MAG: tyrosine-type recombinase/integrase, partial [Pseudolabrys sp.]